MFNQVFQLVRIWPQQWKSISAIEDLQSEKLRKIVKHAYETVPFYQSLFKQYKLHPSDIRDVSCIHKIPVTTKEMLKKAGRDMISRKFPEEKLLIEDTSGSTGKPLLLYKTKATLNLARASKLRTYLTNGFKVHQKVGELNFDLPKPKFYHRLGIHRVYGIPYNDSISEQVALLEKIRPKVLSGYPSRLAEVAIYLRKQNKKTIQSKTIFTQAESLSKGQRNLIHEWLGANPFEIYSTQEFQYVAWECREHHGLHINADLFLLEILSMDNSARKVKNGEKGFVVITDFSNPAMPLLRYNIEDIAEMATDPCPCGRSLPLLKNILGRKIGLLTLPSGEKLPGCVIVSEVLNDRIEIDQYSCCQKKDGSILIEIIKGDGKTVPEELIKDEFRMLCGDIPVKLHYVKEIQKTSAGKLLSFVSEIE